VQNRKSKSSTQRPGKTSGRKRLSQRRRECREDRCADRTGGNLSALQREGAGIKAAQGEMPCSLHPERRRWGGGGEPRGGEEGPRLRAQSQSHPRRSSSKKKTAKDCTRFEKKGKKGGKGSTIKYCRNTPFRLPREPAKDPVRMEEGAGRETSKSVITQLRPQRLKITP